MLKVLYTWRHYWDNKNESVQNVSARMRSSHVKRSDPHNTPQHTLMSVSIAKVASSLQQLSQEASGNLALRAVDVVDLLQVCDIWLFH